MTLQEAIAQGVPLAVTPTVVPSPRLAGDVFVLPQGVAFADAGWHAEINTRPPFHLIEGKVSGEGPWTVERDGEVVGRIHVVEHGDALAGTLNVWMRQIAGLDRAALRADAARAMSVDLGLSIRP